VSQDAASAQAPSEQPFRLLPKSLWPLVVPRENASSAPRPHLRTAL
jgi:hypothetical protein